MPDIATFKFRTGGTLDLVKYLAVITDSAQGVYVQVVQLMVS